MGTAIELRDDFKGDDLRGLARTSRDAGQVRRLLTLRDPSTEGAIP